MSKKLFSLYTSWAEKQQYSTQISQNDINNDTFEVLIEEQRKEEKFVNEKDINFGNEFPEVKFDKSSEKRRKRILFAKLSKLFAIIISILLLLLICTLIISLSLLFFSNHNRPIHLTIIDNTEDLEQHADYQFYFDDVYTEDPPTNYLHENEIPLIPHVFTNTQKKEVMEFYALTDFHLDLSYDPNLYCDDIGTQKNRPKHDISNYSIGQYKCDTPISLLRNLFERMTRFNKSPDFVLFTGDIIQHGEVDFDQYMQTFDTFRSCYLEYFPNTLFLPVLGNHDLYPRKSYIDIVENNENLAQIADAITFSLPPSAVETFKQGGFYSYLLPAPSLSDDDYSTTLLISLNNVVYSPDWAKGCKKLGGSTKECSKERGTDPFGQFAWLNDQLINAESSGYKVIIGMHYGLGMSRGGDPQWEDDYQTVFVGYLTRFQDTVTMLITGHSHRDLFRLLPDELKNKIVVLENSPLTPIDGSNPSFRYMYLNSTTSQIIDYQQAYVNLSAVVSNDVGVEEAWQIEYEFEDLFSVKPTPQGYVHVFNELYEGEIDPDNDYSMYLYNQIVKYYPVSSTIDGKHFYHDEFLCTISNIMNADDVVCLAKKPS